ncbi:metal-dependent transcriptional regulator [Actinotignum sanguinis]|uniref:metal-dependent transcriptional regulator n=1 Tax=Actinotignum sanguinis TaxID=1445614 RepID=UPI00237E3000|nr:metal-dependent transcriptional regulator [Actinotignum sanguinis]MDE1553520.1 iron dependent repressor, metal binding and dimerization domain protein [Actinotignum sanguinis]MDE1565518.1 iron dependent repressor, metal binding and dimerization domain protein [Actinotignum sanguinis]MDE1578019.1 iron dependent repressor, metal binding and dimerization domain protein [Actinotignum sanguinis]MDE1641615.1 iron dependent repressor, metal binding and dimerization domain protein [Actinotignum sang
MSDDLVDTREMYLKAVYELEEEGIVPLRARLVERLSQSKPTVSETVARLERDGMMYLDTNRAIVLTKEGRRIATSVMRKHRVAECFLLHVLGMPWEHVHAEACRWEHVMSRELEERIAHVLGEQGYELSHDPFGNPIPAENSLGPGADIAARTGLLAVADYLERNPSGGKVTIARIGEVIQTDDDVLEAMAAAGIKPDATVTISVEDDGDILARGASGVFPLTDWIRKHLLVHA